MDGVVPVEVAVPRGLEGRHLFN